MGLMGYNRAKIIMRNLLYVLMLLIFVTCGCQKQPTASFTLNKSEYKVGEIVLITNTSVDAFSYHWTLPDGSTSTAQTPSYITSKHDRDVLTFRLIAESKNGKKTSEATQMAQLQRTGDCVFWMSQPTSVVDVTLSQNGSRIDTRLITVYYSSGTPDCGSDGCAVFNDLAPGVYSFYAENLLYYWFGNITIKADECSKMRLSIGNAKANNNPKNKEKIPMTEIFE